MCFWCDEKFFSNQSTASLISQVHFYSFANEIMAKNIHFDLSIVFGTRDCA